MEDIFKKQEALNEHYSTLAKETSILPIKVTPFFKKKVEEEIFFLKNTNGPLCRIAYPCFEKLSQADNNEVKDFIDDLSNMPSSLKNIAVHKYENRLLFLTTPNCFGHCQYCFRQDLLREKDQTTLDEKILKIKEYLHEHQDIQELILSGGDPLTLSALDLEKILSSTRRFKIAIRIHTKAISYDPDSITFEKLKIFQKYKVRLVFHIAHPYEICSTVIDKIQEIQRLKISCYNQFPLLRNINDHSKVLFKLMHLLDHLQIRNLSIFFPEPVLYSAAFRINLKRIFSIMDSFYWNSPSWINSTRFVLDSPIGKVRREHLKKYVQDHYAIFVREEKEIIYPDLPEVLDIPGDLRLMLWKNNN